VPGTPSHEREVAGPDLEAVTVTELAREVVER
jgi:hypothetical protein